MDNCREQGARDVKSRLDSKEGEIIRERAKRLGYAFIMLCVSYLITGARGGFDTYPFSISLICATSCFYLPIFLGFILGYIFSEMQIGYLFAYAAVFAVKFVMSYMPMSVASRELDIHKDRETDSSKLLGGKKSKGGKIFCLVLSVLGISVRKRDGGKVKEERAMCAFFAAIGGFVAGLFDLIFNHFSFYSLYGLIFLTLACPIFALLFFGVAKKGEGVSDAKLCLAILSLMVISVYASGEMKVFGMMLKPMLALCFTLIISHRRGVVAGCITGFLCGIFFSILYLPLIFSIPILYCILKEIKLGAAIASVCAAIVLYCYYFGKAEGMVSMLTPMLLGVAAFLVVIRFLDFISAVPKKQAAEQSKHFEEAVIEKDKGYAVKERIYALSDAFSYLSKRFYELSDAFHRPESLDLRSITDESFECVCKGCRHYDVCFGAEYSSILDANAKITAALHKKGVVEREDIGDMLQKRCIRADRIIQKVNETCAKYTEKIIKGQDAASFASNFQDVHYILLDAINSDIGEYECDTEAGGKIFEYLISLGFDVKGVVVCGKRRKRVIVRGVGLNNMTSGERAENLLRGVSDIMGEGMCGPVFLVSNDGTEMVFNSKPKYSMISSHSRMASFEGIVPYSKSQDNSQNEIQDENLSDQADGEEIKLDDVFGDTISDRRSNYCGDVTSSFVTNNSYFYSLICDGMGSGRDAAYIAGLSRIFAEKMLSAGNKADITLRMLNNFLRSENHKSGKESSVAIDLFEFDLMSGTSAFIKSGAMPTYILRKDKVYRVASKSMPVGIIKAPDIKITKFDMQKGDIVVMLSDGCTHDSDNCKWLIDLLLENKIQDVSELKDRGEEIADNIRDSIMKTSRELIPSNKKPDDISVSVSIIM